MLAALAFAGQMYAGASFPEQDATWRAKRLVSLRFKYVQGRAGPRIDFQQPKALTVHEEVGAV